MTRPPVHGNNRQVQRGQALTEFLVVALVLVPLLIAVPLVGKYIDLMQTAEQASRYVAFEGMNRNTSGSWKTDDELAAEVRRRFFSRSDAPIKTGDTAGDFSADRNPLWTDHAGRPLLDRFNEQVTVSTGTADQSGIRDGSTYVPALDLPTANLYSGTVTVRPSNVPGFAPFDAFDLSITRRTVLLADAWTARGPSSIRSRIENSILLNPLSTVRAMVDMAGNAPPLLYDPAFKIGDFDWDVVPCDRLIGGC